MKCDKCGFETNPGDQICINCGSKLSLNNISNDVYKHVDSVKKEESTSKSGDNKKIIIFTSIAILATALVVFVVLKFIVLR